MYESPGNLVNMQIQQSSSGPEAEILNFQQAGRCCWSCCFMRTLGRKGLNAFTCLLFPQLRLLVNSAPRVIGLVEWVFNLCLPGRASPWGVIQMDLWKTWSGNFLDLLALHCLPSCWIPFYCTALGPYPLCPYWVSLQKTAKEIHSLTHCRKIVKDVIHYVTFCSLFEGSGELSLKFYFQELLLLNTSFFLNLLTLWISWLNALSSLTQCSSNTERWSTC